MTTPFWWLAKNPKSNTNKHAGTLLQHMIWRQCVGADFQHARSNTSYTECTEHIHTSVIYICMYLTSRLPFNKHTKRNSHKLKLEYQMKIQCKYCYSIEMNSKNRYFPSCVLYKSFDSIQSLSRIEYCALPEWNMEL